MNNVEDKPQRPKRTRTRRDGRDVLVKRPDSAGNARPAVTYLFHGLGSGFLKGRPDLRSAVGKAALAREQALVAHAGGDPSVPLGRLIQHAARYSILSDALWARLTISAQEITPEALAGLLDIHMRIAREERETLKLLGLARRPKEVPTLQEFLRDHAAEHDQPEPPTDE
jgi:hypothetical protein